MSLEDGSIALKKRRGKPQPLFSYTEIFTFCQLIFNVRCHLNRIQIYRYA
jgi:hypothetical protein